MITVTNSTCGTRREQGHWFWSGWFALLTMLVSSAQAAALDPGVVRSLTSSFFDGREYFVLRSGRAQLIAQADQADLAPAFLYLLFDAQNNKQSARKATAFNFGDGQGFINSALQVGLGGFALPLWGIRRRPAGRRLTGFRRSRRCGGLAGCA